VVGLVTKYAGGVAKGFALIAGLLITALAQWLIESKSLGIEHWIAASLVSLSIYLHSTYPVKKKTQ
jgi:drug/metabolite transporter (DMT)-like permease